jgi:hypothetical protein
MGQHPSAIINTITSSSSIIIIIILINIIIIINIIKKVPSSPLLTHCASTVLPEDVGHDTTAQLPSFRFSSSSTYRPSTRQERSL